MTVEGWAVVVADVVAFLVFVAQGRQRRVDAAAYTLPSAKLHALRRGRYVIARRK